VKIDDICTPSFYAVSWVWKHTYLKAYPAGARDRDDRQARKHGTRVQ
jgi:hypothetical protein